MAAKKKSKKKTVNKAGARKTVAEESVAGTGEELGQDILSMEQAIQLLKTTRPTFYRWLRQGKVKGMKVGRQWRFEKTEIERFMKGEEPRIELTADIKPLIAELRKRLKQIDVDMPPDNALEASAEAVNLLITLGLFMRSSDIHIGPLQKPDTNNNTAAIRYRVDGALQEPLEFDRRLLSPIVARWKTMAACDAGEKHLPQDGRILLTIKKKRVDLRVSFLPLAHGESLTARILDRQSVTINLDAINYSDNDRERLMKALGAPCGMIVMTGPTGSGKTTNLYACINHVAKQSVKTITLEDPVEYLLPRVDQVQISPKRGLTFSRALRSVLRSDPDVIMVGEIRDAETLTISQQAALTGHLLLTTMHTDETASALTRMIEIGSPPFLVADSVLAVAAQRLVRKICPECRESYTPGQQELVRIKTLADSAGGGSMPMPERLFRGKGCPACNHSGFRGRNIIAEILEVTPQINKALRREATTTELRAIAVGQGMTTMAVDGLVKVAKGETTINEIYRVVGMLY